MKPFRKTAVALLFLACVAPSLALVRTAFADEEGDGDEPETKSRPTTVAPMKTPQERKEAERKLLLAIPTDETALINVSSRDLPASPDQMILNLGRKSEKALARCVADNVDDSIRITCARILGRLGDPAAVTALQGALEAWSPEVRGAALSALTSLAVGSATESLKRILEREDEELGNQKLALRALGTAGTGEAVRTLRKVLRDTREEKKALKVSAFDGLWRTRHIVARGDLISDIEFALKSTDDALVLRATLASAELRDPALVGSLIPLMTKSHVRIRNRAVYALGKIGDKKASSALVAHVPKVREARMLNNVAFALERLDAQAFYGTIGQLVSHKQAAIRMNAAFVIGDVRRPEGLPFLQKTLADKNDLVRMSSIHALGNIDSKEAATLLEQYTNDKDPQVRNAATFALFQQSGNKRTDVLFDRVYAKTDGEKPSDVALKHQALLLLANALDPRVANDALDCLDKRACSVRDLETFLLASPDPRIPGRLVLDWATGAYGVNGLIAARKPAGVGMLAVSAVGRYLAQGRTQSAAAATDVIGDYNEKGGTDLLKALLLNPSARIRVHAALALSRLSDASADAVLFREFDNLASDHVEEFGEACGRVTEPAVRARLLPELKKRSLSSDPRAAMAVSSCLLQWDPEQTIFRFLDALASKNVIERDLARRYLHEDRRRVVTSVLRRALAREERPYVRDALRALVDGRPKGH